MCRLQVPRLSLKIIINIGIKDELQCCHNFVSSDTPKRKYLFSLGIPRLKRKYLHFIIQQIHLPKIVTSSAITSTATVNNIRRQFFFSNFFLNVVPFVKAIAIVRTQSNNFCGHRVNSIIYSIE